MLLIRLGALAIVLTLAVAQPAAAIGPGRSGANAPLYYLSLGDSLAAGVQPIGDPANLYRTDQGYADQLFAMAREWYPNLQLVKLGCPGETTGTMIDGGVCAYDHGSQLDEAVAFLHAHGKFVAFVSIDIGFNDFPCQTSLACLPPGFATIRQNLPTILAALREAAPPETPIVGATIYDPFLAYWLTGSEGQALAQLSVSEAIVPLNRLLTEIYGAARMPVADIEGAFSTTDFATMVPLPPFGQVPLSVARLCQWTWVCAPEPLGPDNHANAAGYSAMAEAFAAVLKPGNAHLWLGLKSGDDQGTQFDVQVELIRSGTSVASGLTRCVTSLTRNQAYAKQVSVPWNSPAPSIASGDLISIWTRIGTNLDGTKCAGPGGSHNNAVALRLYYDAVGRASRFEAGGGDLYLHSDGGGCDKPAATKDSQGVTTRFLDTTAPTATLVKCKDSGKLNFAGGNPFTLVGTWTMP